jgi:AcrR family transcriptional regulator
MIELVGRGGFSAVTVRELSDLSGVSSRSFYQRFKGKEDCFERTYEFIVRGAAKRVIASQGGEKDWEARVRLACRAFARELERDPLAARLALIETQASSASAKQRTHWAEGLFAAMLAESFAHAQQSTPLPRSFCLALVAGTAFVARSRILWEEEGTPQFGDQLADWVLNCRRAYLTQCNANAPGSPSPGATAGADGPQPLRSSRDLILLATAKLAASEAGPLTLPRILEGAGVSRLTFDSQFDGIEDCLIATAESLGDQVFGPATLVKESAGSWADGVRLAMSTLCEWTANDRALARLWFTEIPALGLDGMYCCERLTSEIGDLISYGSPGGGPDDTAVEASAGAIWAVLRQLAGSPPLAGVQAITLLTSLAVAPQMD